MWVVLRLNKWEDIELEQTGTRIIPFPVHLVKPDDGTIGVMFVFDDYEAALEYAKDANLILKIREVENEKY